VPSTVQDDDPASSGIESTDSAPLNLAIGDTVVTVEKFVNLRKGPAFDAEVVSVLPLGTDLVVTEDAIDAAGHRWRPVRSDTLDVEGYVVETFIQIVT
jgi:hypothetical protein